MGTASNQNGFFVLNVPENLRDSIFFCSYVGYGTFYGVVAQMENVVNISLIEEKVILDEVEVRPWSAWEYIQAAIDHIPDNYLSEPFETTNFYNEYITENGDFLKYTEGVIQTFNPAYGDTLKIASKLIQARSRDDLESIAFMRKRLEKRMDKEIKKAEKKGEEVEIEDLDDAVLSASFGGPRQILRSDPVRDTASFLNPKYRKLYDYSIKGYSTYHGLKVIIIHFESRKKHEYRKRKGDIFITIETDAIVALDFQSRIYIPDLARPVMFLMAFGATDPVIKAKMHYKPYNGRWFINDISINASSILTHKKLFKSNDHSLFELYQSLITTAINLDNVSPIPKSDQLNNWEPLEKQIEEDPDFWENYKVVQPEGISN